MATRACKSKAGHGGPSIQKESIVTYNQFSRALYKAARLSRDIRAVQQGPDAIVKRLVRRQVYRKSNQFAASISRLLLGGASARKPKKGMLP